MPVGKAPFSAEVNGFQHIVEVVGCKGKRSGVYIIAREASFNHSLESKLQTQSADVRI
jgi:hypothetical protein